MPQSLDVQLMSQSGFVPLAIPELHVYLQLDQHAGPQLEPIALPVELLLAFLALHAQLDITIGLVVFAIQLYKQILQIASLVPQCGHFAQFALQDSSFKLPEVAQQQHAHKTAPIAQVPQPVQFAIPLISSETEFASHLEQLDQQL